MSPAETQAVLSLSLLAAFVDGDKHERERAEIKRIAEGLSSADGVNLPMLYQDVLMKRVTLASVAQSLQSRESKQLAFEMAVCVCDADGAQSKAEQAFLDQARSALGLEQAGSRQFSDSAESLAEAPLDGPLPKVAAASMAAAAAETDTSVASPMPAIPIPMPGSTSAGTLVTQAKDAPVATPAPTGAPVTLPNISEAELDKTILNASITNGALELLPESLSTMAIIPLQMRLVYRIGQAYGFELDRGHIKDFLATVGVGLTSQYLEQAGRKLLGGLLGKVGGGLLRGVGNQAVSSGMSFASTYALGHVAKQYYAGGRTLSTQMLKDAYASVTQEAQGMQQKYLPAMREQARTLDVSKVLAMVRGK
jgi:uncharacterized protein (DUF697 family)/tellurite resistance protein